MAKGYWVARVGVAEDRALGGTCVNVGCVPKKLLVTGAHFADEVRDARGFGWTVEAPTHDWAALIANKDREIARLNGIYLDMLAKAGQYKEAVQYGQRSIEAGKVKGEEAPAEDAAPAQPTPGEGN